MQCCAGWQAGRVWGGTAKHKDFVERTDTHTERFVHFRKKNGFLVG